jgi:hypothetical protein
MSEEPTPFHLPPQKWANFKAVTTMIGVLPVVAAAIFYLLETPAREAAAIADAWRAVMGRPKVDVGFDDGAPGNFRNARNWGVRPALEFLVARNQKLNSVDLFGADLSAVNLRNGSFGWGGFRGSTFVNANLEGTNFECADLRGATFLGASLTGANFRSANISGAAFVLTDSNRSDIERILRLSCKDPADEGPGYVLIHNETKHSEFGVLEKCLTINRAIPLGKNC